MQREIKIVLEQVNLYNLDCSDLTIITECASGVYGFNVLVPLLGKAKQVIAVGQDSCYGSYQDNKAHLLNICKHAQVDVKKLSIVNQLSDSDITSADIITNSGFVRPINAEMIKKMKKTAVIPLMWETWEFRHQDLDLFSAREYEIMVLGTDESYFKLAMYPYGGMLGLSALFRVGLEIYKTRAILLGGGILGQAIADSFSKNGVKFKWYVENPYQKNFTPFLLKLLLS